MRGRSVVSFSGLWFVGKASVEEAPEAVSAASEKPKAEAAEPVP